MLTATLNYYRHIFNPTNDQPALQAIRERYGEPIAVPTLYLHGARDGGIGVETTEGMEGWFRNGLEKRIIADAGHFVHQEKPDKVNRLILEFIQSELNAEDW
ncbi:MAG: alpha/beta hydrolase [Chloroflexota bacterium]